MFFLSYGYTYEYQSDELYKDGKYTIKIVSYDSNTKIYQVVDEGDNKGTIYESVPEPEPEPGKRLKLLMIILKKHVNYGPLIRIKRYLFMDIYLIGILQL